MKKPKSFKRICPSCGNSIRHSTEALYKKAVETNAVCKPCEMKMRPPPEEWIRTCPICQKTRHYITYLGWHQANLNNSVCQACVNAPRKKDHMTNPRAWKKVCPECKKNIQYNCYSTWMRAKEFDSKCWNCGKPKPTTGKTRVCRSCGKTIVYALRSGRCNAEKANGVCQTCANKKRKGKNSTLYGTPPPQNTGYGWSGWYKNTFFRSAKELYFIINVLEKRNKVWRTAETKDLMIKYIDTEGVSRTYTADFLVNEKILVEVKTRNHQQDPKVQEKARAAKAFCTEKGWKYLMLEPKGFTRSEVISLRKNKVISLTRKNEEKYQKYIQEEA